MQDDYWKAIETVENSLGVAIAVTSTGALDMRFRTKMDADQFKEGFSSGMRLRKLCLKFKNPLYSSYGFGYYMGWHSANFTNSQKILEDLARWQSGKRKKT